MSIAYKLSPVRSRRSSSKRERLLDAAARCVARDGLSKTSMEAIAAEAEVARITVYREFGTRTALVDALIAHRANQFNERFAATAGPFPNMAAALEAYLIAAVAHLRDSPVTMQFVRGRMAFTKPGSALHEVTGALWRPWIELAREKSELPTDMSFDEAVEWILVLQHTFCRMALEAAASDAHLRRMVRCFVAPAFSRPAQP